MPNDERDRINRSAEQARQGRIVLCNRQRRVIFFGGLIAAVVLALIGVAAWY